MKKLIIMCLLGYTGYSQEMSMHFFYATAQNIGAETLIHIRGTESTYLGGGFSGVLYRTKADGKYLPGEINDYDMQYATNIVSEPWCSLYVTGSLGYYKSLLIKARLGVGVNYIQQNFANPYNEPYYYNKTRCLEAMPLVGMSAMYPITNDWGVELGVDTFNKVTFGLTVLF
jgi:hypothetical protein